MGCIYCRPHSRKPCDAESDLASTGWARQTLFAPTQSAYLELGLYDSDLV